MKSLRLLAAICILSLLFGCAKVHVSPPLSSSLSYSAYKNLEKIDVRDVSVALVLDKKLLNAKTKQNIKMGIFKFSIGKTFATKFIKALTHQFKTIKLMDKFDYKKAANYDSIMRVSLQDIDSSMEVKQGFSKVSTECYTRLNVRAELKDVSEKRVVWVGTTQVKHTGGIEEKMLTYQEAGGGFSRSIDQAIDIAIGDLLREMQKSKNLNKYFIKWESHK